MALVILAHPNYETSIANKTIIEEMFKYDTNLEIRNIYKLYPDYKIDVEAEQQALLRHDTIIFQYPMFWFNMPAILKLWLDDVFTYQFAYGSQGDKLKSKKTIVSTTVGQPENNMKNDDENLMDSFLKSMEYSIKYTQMELVKSVSLHDVSPLSGHSEIDIRNRAVEYGKNLIDVIKNH
jgi:glutathione-regulated potassium-efflux system ancillary protein KefF